MTTARNALIGFAFVLSAALAPTGSAAQEAPARDAALAHEHALTLLAGGKGHEARDFLEGLDEGHARAEPRLAALLGTLRREAGELDGAMRTFERALDSGPGELEATLWTELAVTRSWTGDLDGAEDAYRKALAAEGDFRPAVSGLARILRWKGDAAEAEDLYRRLLADGGDPVDAYVGMGYLALEALRGEEARDWFGRALELAPGNVEAREGLGRLHEAHRLKVSWNATRSRQGSGGTERAEWALAASYRVTPRSTALGSLNLAPQARDVVGSDPNVSELIELNWSASLGWAQEIARGWNAAASLQRVASPYGGGYLATVESGRWLGSRWNVNGGMRGGQLPRIGRELMGWAGLTRIGAERRAASMTMFYGTDLRGTWSRSLLVAGSTAAGERTTLRATFAKGWTSSVGFHQATLEGRFTLGGGRELTAELFRFDGAYRRTGLRVGARMGF